MEIDALAGHHGFIQRSDWSAAEARDQNNRGRHGRVQGSQPGKSGSSGTTADPRSGKAKGRGKAAGAKTGGTQVTCFRCSKVGHRQAHCTVKL
eukprot:2767359-Heterocapsa_arctica.AAC.2